MFMPVYNGSKYLTASINSVINQTFKDFELVCVDDSSTDNSYEMLRQFAATDTRIRIFQKPNGGTVPKSWNFVLPRLNGASIAYMSQDDLMSEDNLGKLYQRQQETGADCVLPDMVLYFGNRNDTRNKVVAGVNGNRETILTNREAVRLSLDWTIHGFGLWKANIIKEEAFPEDSYDSDEYVTRKLFSKCNKVAFCTGTFFYRQDNQQAITKTVSIKNYYSILTLLHILQLLEDLKFDPETMDHELGALYLTYMDFYRFCSLRRSINSDSDYAKIKALLADVFPQLQKRQLHGYTICGKRYHPWKMRCFRVLFYNFTAFKILMFMIYSIRPPQPDKSKFLSA